MTATERAQLATQLATGMARTIKSAVIRRGVRKSGMDVSTLEVTNENLSLAKCLKGQLFNNWENADVEKSLCKALGTDDGTMGGFLVPPQLSNELIESLMATAILPTMPGVRRVVLDRDQLDLNRIDNSPAITWGSQGGTLTEDTTMSFGQVSLVLKKATCLMKIDTELLEETGNTAEEIVRSELVRKMGEEVDTVILKGTGGTQPSGMYYHPGMLNTDLNAGISIDDLSAADEQVRLQNGRITGWVCDPRVSGDIRLLKDGSGRFILNVGDMLGSAGVPIYGMSIWNAPLKDTTVISTGNFPGSGETFMVGGQWDNLLIGTSRRGLRIESNSGPYFANDQVGIRCVLRTGYAIRHPETFCRITGITV